jgi:hypothetical protein
MSKITDTLTREISSGFAQQMRALLSAGAAIAAAENLEDELRVHGIEAHASGHLVDEGVTVVVFSLDAPEAVLDALMDAEVTHQVLDISTIPMEHAQALIECIHHGQRVQIYVTHKRPAMSVRQIDAAPACEPVSLYREPEAA